MRKRVIGGVVLLLVSSLLAYLLPRQPPDDVLVMMQEILSELEEMYDGRYIRVMPIFTKPNNGLNGEKVKLIRRKLREAGINSASLSCSERRCLSIYSINRSFNIFLNYRYYLYDSGDLLEEVIVDNVEKAIEENTKVHYAFCERTEAEHWFYCENNH